MKIENTFYIETVNMNDITNQQKLVMEGCCSRVLHLFKTFYSLLNINFVTYSSYLTT